MRAGRVPILLLFTAGAVPGLPGCAGGGGGGAPRAETVRPVRLTMHLAYREEQPGCLPMETPAGETLWVARQPEFSTVDIAAARVLHGGGRNMLQLVLRPFAAGRLEALTRRYCRRIQPVYGPTGALVEQRLAAWLAVLVDGKLVCTLPIEYPVSTGEIYLVDVFSDERAAELSAALSAPEGP